MRKTPLIVVLCTSAALIAGCASPAPDTVTPRATATVTDTVVSLVESTPPEVETDTIVPVETSEPDPTTAEDPAVDQALMPDVTCMNLQDAQNAIQDEGVFYSRSNDATGAGRHQLVDTNWTVVSQSPAAGTPIGEGDAMLSAVKIGEPGDCS